MTHSAIFGFSKHGFDIGVAAERNFVIVRIDPFELDDFARTDGSTKSDLFQHLLIQCGVIDVGCD